jgi:hypothetical protein
VIAEILQKLRSFTGQPGNRSRGYESELQRKFADLRPNLSPSEIQVLRRNFLGRVTPDVFQLVPGELLSLFQRLVEGVSPRVICDPWAGIGAVIAAVQEVHSNAKAYAFTRNVSEEAVGTILAPEAGWTLGDPIKLVRTLTEPIDLAVSILPFGLKQNRPANFSTKDGSSMKFRTDLGHALLIATLDHLSLNGVGLFVVEPSFFWSPKSVRWELDELGFSLSAAFALPAGTFAPYTQISTHLVVIGRKATKRLFVAQLSRDEKTNDQIVANFRGSVDTGTVELGCFIESANFRTLADIRLKDSLLQMKHSFGCPPRHLGELALQINRLHSRDAKEFEPLENAIFIPLVGKSFVHTSDADLTLKLHNYAQVVIDKSLSDARFVAQFLNTELGREIREAHKTGITIQTLSTEGLKKLPIFIPSLETQTRMLEIRARIAGEESALLGLQNELASLLRDMWRNPSDTAQISDRLDRFASRLSPNIRKNVAGNLEEWFESLPFPLSSILRAWQATALDDFKTKYEHLLHFFEAMAEFTSVIFLSAFSSQETAFQQHREALARGLQKQNLSFLRPTFGTWKVVIEYLGSRTRSLLSGSEDDRTVCGEMFADPSLSLPVAISRQELMPIVSATNKRRNEWTGHGGVVGQSEARLRNEELLLQLQKFRDATGDVWVTADLLQPLNCKPRQGIFENDVAILTGSNSEFLKEKRKMATWLDLDRLYIAQKSAPRALALLPLIRVGPSPSSATNACYFFNRMERDGARFVSFHFVDQPELTGDFDSTAEAIRLLSLNELPGASNITK